MNSTPVKVKKRMGKHTTFKPEYIELARSVCEKFGASDIELAAVLKCKVSRMLHWQHDFPTFQQAIREGRDLHATSKVEKTLLKRALGYSYKEVVTKQTVLRVPQGRGKPVIKLPAIETTIYKKRQAPDVTAILFFLQNRNPNRWRNVKYLIADGEVRTVDRKEFLLDVKSCTEDELHVIRALMQRKKDTKAAIDAEVIKSETDNGNGQTVPHGA